MIDEARIEGARAGEQGAAPPKYFGPNHPVIQTGEVAINARQTAAKLVGYALLGTVIGIGMLALRHSEIGLIPWLFGALLGFCGLISAGVGVLTGVFSLLGLAVSSRRGPPGFARQVFGATLTNAGLVFAGGFMALMATASFGRGRQLRRFGKILLPEVTPGDGWTRVPMSVDVGDGPATELAAQWRENGRTEHASVGAFARLTLDLMALGAPPALIAASNKDSLDEIRHTELCFSLARSLDGREESPAAFPQAMKARTLPSGRSLAIAALAVDSLVDGALHEGVSARVIARLAKVCEVPAIRGVLREIAADEGRHSAHGWDVVEWCLATGGAPVAAALRGAVKALPETIRSEIPAAAESGAWERFGIQGKALEAEEFAKARADLIKRVEKMLAKQDAPGVAFRAGDAVRNSEVVAAFEA